MRVSQDWDGCIGISIWSHGESVSIDAQSAAKEKASAHRETGLGPTRINPKTITKLRSFFTVSAAYNLLRISIAHIIITCKCGKSHRRHGSDWLH